MAKILKISGRFVGILLEWTLIILTVFAFAIRTSQVQTYLAGLATDFLSKELNTTFRIDKVSIVFIDRVALDGVLILDQNKDTLADIKRIYLSIDRIDLNKNKIDFGKAELEKGNVHLSRDSLKGDYNYWFITDYFDTGKPKKKKKPMEISLAKLALHDVDFKYDDYRKKYREYGIDFNHIALNDLSFTANNFSVKNKQVVFEISGLKAKEKSGFDLREFDTQAKISGTGIYLSDLKIKTLRSDIKAGKLNLLFNGIDDFQTFEDSVSFDAQLQRSKVSMADISLFASQLQGMDAIVELEGKVTEKVKNLKLRDMYLSIGRKTVIRGDLNLPDFRNFKQAFFTEKIDYAYIDLKDLSKIKLPLSSSQKYMSFDKYLNRLGYFKARDVRLDGFYSQFVLAANKITTSLGSVKLDNGIMFTENAKNGSYLFARSASSEYDVKIEQFKLGKFLEDRNFGTVDGTFFLTGEAFSTADIHFTDIEGDVNRFDYMNYAYTDIFVTEGSFIDKIFTAQIDVKDDNLNLVYKGTIDLNGPQHMVFSVDIKKALLDHLGITQNDSTSIVSNFRVDITGRDPNKMFGTVTMDSIVYKEGKRAIRLPELKIAVERGKIDDVFSIDSDLGKFNLTGKVDFTTLVSDFTKQFDKVFPGMINELTVKKATQKSHSRFSYDFTTRHMDDFLAIFVPDLKIEEGTILKGDYHGDNENFTMFLTSGLIKYQDMKFGGVRVEQGLTSENINAIYTLKYFSYGDSIKIDNVKFTTNGKNNVLNSKIIWNQSSTNASDITWQTTIVDNSKLKIVLEPSYFSVNEQRWEVASQSDIFASTTDIQVSNFKLTRSKQYIEINGHISRNDSDKLNLKIHDLDLQDVGELIGTDVEMEGLVNGWGYISNPYTNLTYMGDASVLGLHINKEEVGDVFVQTQWNRASESVGLTGDLMYRGAQTFAFQGSYFTEKESDNLDLYLLFDQTDIQFTNAFMDPDVISNIRGQLDGNLKVTGTPSKPELEGRVKLKGGNAKIELLGVNFGFDGQIISDKYGFYINNMPIRDEEGNTGSLIGSVYHENFVDWNYDVQVYLEGEENEDADLFSWAPASGRLPERFLIMNTPYKEGETYYGKAYGTGEVNIFGYTDNIEITVDMTTKRGTKINFPMYGVSDFEEEDNFIRFVSKGSSTALNIPKVDFTGVELDLNFKVTPEAKLKIIFNEQLGDEITATGNGDISMKMDNLGDLQLEGTYKVKEGVYNFAMGPIKQPFYIQEGGTITWTGDPYNANLDLKTYYKVNASLSEISPNELQGTANVNNQEVLCYLALNESLMKPTIGFDIKSPKANETGKALLSRITNDPDELNRQFFSLLLWKRFQPLKGTTAAAGGSAALDLVSNQINSVLAMVSKDYKMNVNLDRDELTKEQSYEFGVSKGFLDNRLIVTGSFGVENNVPSGQQAQSMLIGDVSVEYLLNQNGTFRINIFNESNDYSIIQDKNLGLFTQGAGINYQEDFDNIENFKLVQYLLDIFRSKENKRITIKRNKEQTPVPATGEPPLSFLPSQEPSVRKN